MSEFCEICDSDMHRADCWVGLQARIAAALEVCADGWVNLDYLPGSPAGGLWVSVDDIRAALSEGAPK